MKNKFMRTAALLMVLCLVTSSLVGGTFAKYVTSQNATDSARVAKWGVTVTANSDLFGTQYTTTDTTLGLDNNVSVASNNKVIAPGLQSNVATFKITGTPEVATKVSYKLNSFDLNNWTIPNGDGGNVEYCPLVITINGTPYKIGDTGIDDVAALQAKVKAVIEAYSKVYDAGVDLSSKETESLKVKVSWPFTANGNDVKDTALGDNSTAPTIALNITATVEQVGGDNTVKAAA